MDAFFNRPWMHAWLGRDSKNLLLERDEVHRQQSHNAEGITGTRSAAQLLANGRRVRAKALGAAGS